MTQEFGSTGQRKVERARSFKRFVRDQRGSTALEFALLALPFALLVFAILESCISFAGQEVMSNITDDVARQLRTGQLRPADVAGSNLTNLICGKLQIIVSQDCPNQLLVDLRQYSTFADAASASFQIQNGDVVLMQGGTAQAFANSPGPSGSKNMLRVFYKWPVMTDMLAKSMANLNGGRTLHYSSVTWQNEPF